MPSARVHLVDGFFHYKGILKACDVFCRKRKGKLELMKIINIEGGLEWKNYEYLYCNDSAAYKQQTREVDASWEVLTHGK
ncbi:hypothetical protein SPACI_049480 [Sporomusa acidovorans DSM 3132]|uniref:Uncharacterized protein n=1 Tax=Sporomusa acidovorans (strain ATCC 49682 / DSM 3132 / Mol) TaxID=1123286 RepID=A0ABZ3J8W1_SPOA4|nr:hypothetical protein SPACI_45940 [Sporomusa acidovorans DSM 3132]